MPLWNIIRNWFVVNIWGGHYNSAEGWVSVDKRYLVYATDSGYLDEVGVFTSNYKILGDISLGDWLSTTSTIIILIAISIGLFFLTRYFFRMFAGLISGR